MSEQYPNIKDLLKLDGEPSLTEDQEKEIEEKFKRLISECDRNEALAELSARKIYLNC